MKRTERNWAKLPPNVIEKIVLQLICDALRAQNAIVGINLKTDECYFSEKTFREMAKLVKLMTKATHFEIRIPITTKAEAKRLWKLLRMACQTNDHAEMIKFDYGNPSGFDNTRESVASGHIANCSGPPKKS